MSTIRVTAVLLTALALNSQGLTPSRSYQWSFKEGNLVPNWSFENNVDTWMDAPASGCTVNPHFKAAGTEITSAHSGSFVAQAIGGGSGGPCLLSTPLPFTPSTNYTLSFYYQTRGTLSGSVHADIQWFNAGTQVTSVAGTTLTSASGSWVLNVLTVVAPTGAQTLRVVLADFSSGATGTYYFDDVVLEEGSLDSATVAAHRQNNTEAMAFTDALGRTHQTDLKLNPFGNQYLISGVGFDAFARPESTFLSTPYVTPQPVFLSSLLSGAQGVYNASGPFNAKGYPFSRVSYADDPQSQVLESSSPDSAWQMGNGHTIKQNSYFVQDSLVPADIENPLFNNNVECPYRLDWSKNQDSTYTLTWTNRLGQVVRTASNLTRNGTDARTWKWAATRYEYYPTGAVKKVYTPLDDSAGTSAFAEVSQQNALGQVVSTFSPDRNLKKFWYNRLGQLRYSQDEEQRAAGEFTYFEYDGLGRLVSKGVQVVASLPQDSVDQDRYTQGTQIEEVGYLYDDTATFASRTGFTLQEILHGWQGNIANTSGRLVCEYHKNPDNPYGPFTAKDRFVADFFTYDEEGNVHTSWKYVGAVRDTVKRVQDIWYQYDAQNRLQMFTNYTAADETSPSNSESYTYDYLGQVAGIAGISGKPLAAFSYANWGPLTRVALGGTATGDSATFLDYFYHSQGGLRLVQATGLNGKHLFQQYLGREDKAYAAAGNPALLSPKFDGSIAQQTYKFTADLNLLKPVRTVNYGYDQLDRMKTAKAYWNSNASPLDGNEDILPGALTMAATDTLSTSMDYDLNGRISGQRSGGVASVDSARYTYLSNSYRLDKVTGLLSPGSTRALSASGTFTYDNNGALLQDKSKRMNVRYGWDGLPVSFSVDSLTLKGVVRCCTYDADGFPLLFKLPYPTATAYNFFDAEGNRVARVEVESKTNLSNPYRLRSETYTYMGPGMLKEWDETYYQLGRVKGTQALVSLLGRGGNTIGRIRPDGKYEFYVKNHLGSTMYTVDDRGRYNTGDQKAYDYLAYGPYKLLKTGSDTTDVREKWTGKELEGATGLYAFGARWYDPELALFLGADPAGQYANPYSYGPGDPMNGVDPDGRSFCIWGFCIGGDDSKGDDGGVTTKDVVETYQTNDKLQQAGDLYIKYANAMVLSTASAGGAAYLVSGWSVAATGYMGLATNSGLVAAMTGGGVTGLAAGGVSGFVGYSAANYDDWDAGDALQATLWGAGVGAATGAIFSGVGYGVSNDFRNATHQTVIEYGYNHGREQDAINYTKSAYHIRGNFTYEGASTGLIKGARGYTPSPGNHLIYEDAFRDPTNGNVDGSSLVATMDHESGHTLGNPGYIQEATGYGLEVRGPYSKGGAYVEAQTYAEQSYLAEAHGYSPGIRNYINHQYWAYAMYSGVLPW